MFPDVTDEQWNDWKWQVKNRIETLEDLKKYVSLTAEEAAMVQSGNSLTFKVFPLLQQGGKSFVFSPLSLQYALGMTANGASGKTLEEIVDALGFGNDLGKLNALCNKLLNELPALDKEVKLQLADAILVNDQYPLLPSFKEKVESTYYAAVENMSFADPDAVAARINDWASRNTNGLIDKMLEAGQIHPNALAFLMNLIRYEAPPSIREGANSGGAESARQTARLVAPKLANSLTVTMVRLSDASEM